MVPGRLNVLTPRAMLPCKYKVRLDCLLEAQRKAEVRGSRWHQIASNL